VRGVALDARRADARARKEAAKARDSNVAKFADAATSDSFVNFQHKLGIGADNPLSSATYGFNPITRIRTLLEWIHRGSWLGGVAVDIIAEDMTKMGVELQSDLDPTDIRKIEELAVALRVWPNSCSTVKWARLFGGAIAVMLVEGQRFDTPLRVETVGRNQFKGLFVLDRWQVEPSLNDLVQDLGPDLGLPKFYKVLADAPALFGQRIHHSRVMRLQGIELSYYQRLIEQLWGESEIERLYDRMVAFDSTTTGAAQLAYKAYLRTYQIEGLRDIIAAGGKPLEGLLRYVDMFRRFQTMEGMTLLDMKDKFEGTERTVFAGLADLMIAFAQQVAGALQIPLVRLLGQAPAGLNSTGESDLRTYYDNIKARQETSFRVPMTRVYRALAGSAGIKLPDGFWIQFRSLWQLQEKEKAEIAETDGRSIAAAEERGFMSQATAMRELKQSSHVTGRFSNITDAEIAQADEELAPRGEEALGPDGEPIETPARSAGAPPKKKTNGAAEHADDGVTAVRDAAVRDALQRAQDANAKAMDSLAASNRVLADALSRQREPIVVPPAAVTVHEGDTRVEVQPAAAPEVKVPVTVEGAQVHVAPAAAPRVEVPVSLTVKGHPKSTRETIKRDVEGEIIERNIEHKE